jgi:hypothetical protein
MNTSRKETHTKTCGCYPSIQQDEPEEYATPRMTGSPPEEEEKNTDYEEEEDSQD